MINQEWKIKPRSGVCSETGRSFADGEGFYTALFEDQTEDGFVRKDYCLEAWESAKASGEKPFSHWKSVYEVPKSEGKKDVVEKESAEGLLRRLIQEEEPSTENARFILAVMLERKKTLKETDSQRLPDGQLRIYEHAKSGEVFIVKDPLLRMDQIASVQEQVAELLSQKPPTPPEELSSIAESPVDPAAEIELSSGSLPDDGNSEK